MRLFLSISLLFFIFTVKYSYAQVVTTPMENNAVIQRFLAANPGYKFQPNEKNKFGNRDTLSLPFFDDFAQSNIYPDSTKWLNNQVYVNSQFPILPPTINVATFDALDPFGYPYRNTLNKDLSTAGDSLTSQPINLKDKGGTLYSLSDSMVFSFFYQPNGNGYHLNGEDSIRLWFKAANGFWFQIWSKGGVGTSQDFKQVVIPIVDANFLHEGFQFMFTTFTRQVGNANHWHVDYVFFDEKRKVNEAYYDDYAIQGQPASLLKTFWSMPYDHFSMNPGIHEQDAVYFRVSNRFNVGKNIQPSNEVTFNSTILSQTGGSVNQKNLGGENSIEFNLPKYSLTGLSGTDPIEIKRTISVREDSKINLNPFRVNDTIIATQIFHDYYAYDDGSAERGFGFDQNTNPSNIAGQIAYGFDLAKEDTLYAIGTFFNQAVYDVSRRRFKLRVWQSLNGVDGADQDILVYESDEMTPIYSIANGERTFTPYYLDTTLVLPAGKFYIGWHQSEMYNLNVGWDMNFGNARNSNKKNPNLYAKSIGGWSNDVPDGTLMMRPHFGSERELYAAVYSPIAEDNHPKVYPNPATNVVHLGGRYASVKLYNLSGLEVLSTADTDEINVLGIVPGIYYLKRANDDYEQIISKLVILDN
ncbi:MAG: hypothetical protein ACJA19_000518 [Bacteroidia bacterium]|jgi:hypothetical protein